MSEEATETQTQTEEARIDQEAKEAKEAAKVRADRAKAAADAREKRVKEVQGKQPQPGEPGYYSPPFNESVIRSPRREVPLEDPPPGMSPEEQPVSVVPGQTGQTGETAEGTPAKGAGSSKSGAPANQVNYDDMTVAELKDLAHQRGIEVHSDWLKDDIIKALKKADK